MEALDALGNPVRRDILDLLHAQERTVVDLAGHFPISRPAISRHLKLLQDAGLVERREEGRTNVYALRPEGFAAVEAYLSRFWDEALVRFRMVVENVE